MGMKDNNKNNVTNQDQLMDEEDIVSANEMTGFFQDIEPTPEMLLAFHRLFNKK